ncbi:MAG: hypothetical protein ACRDGQ_14795 [Candidatus Limnocylindrales bacterium]
MILLEVVLGFLILTPFPLGAMFFSRNPRTRERLLYTAVRQIREPNLGQSRLGGIVMFAFFYSLMFLFMEIGIHM